MLWTNQNAPLFNWCGMFWTNQNAPLLIEIAWFGPIRMLHCLIEVTWWWPIKMLHCWLRFQDLDQSECSNPSFEPIIMLNFYWGCMMWTNLEWSIVDKCCMIWTNQNAPCLIEVPWCGPIRMLHCWLRLHDLNQSEWSIVCVLLYSFLYSGKCSFHSKATFTNNSHIPSP